MSHRRDETPPRGPRNLMSGDGGRPREAVHGVVEEHVVVVAAAREPLAVGGEGELPDPLLAVPAFVHHGEVRGLHHHERPVALVVFEFAGAEANGEQRAVGREAHGTAHGVQRLDLRRIPRS